MSELVEGQQRQMDLYELREQVKAALVMGRALVQDDSLAWFVVTGMSGWLDRHDRQVRAEAWDEAASWDVDNERELRNANPYRGAAEDTSQEWRL